MVRTLKRLWRLITGRRRRMEKFYRQYVKDDIPSHYLLIDSPGEGRVKGVLVGHNRKNVYIRRPNLTVSTFSKADVIRAGLKYLHEQTVYADISCRLAKLKFETPGLYSVRPRASGPLSVKCPDASPPSFRVADIEASRTANRLLYFQDYLDGDFVFPDLIAMLVRIDTGKHIVAWFPSELEVINEETVVES